MEGLQRIVIVCSSTLRLDAGLHRPDSELCFAILGLPCFLETIEVGSNFQNRKGFELAGSCRQEGRLT